MDRIEPLRPSVEKVKSFCHAVQAWLESVTSYLTDEDMMDVMDEDGSVELTKDDDYTWKQSSGRSLNLPGGGQEVEVEMDSLHEFLQSGSCFILKPAAGERHKLLLAQVDHPWNHRNGRRLNLPGQGQEVEDGSRGKFLASNFRFVDESNWVLGSRPKIWAPNQDKKIKRQENSNADAHISCFTCTQTVVLVSSSLMLCAVPWFLNTKKKAINGVASAINNSWLLWPRNMIIWIDIALMVAAPASLLAVKMKASKPQFARLCGIIATLCLIFAVVLLLSTLISLVSSVNI